MVLNFSAATKQGVISIQLLDVPIVEQVPVHTNSRVMVALGCEVRKLNNSGVMIWGVNSISRWGGKRRHTDVNLTPQRPLLAPTIRKTCAICMGFLTWGKSLQAPWDDSWPSWFRSSWKSHLCQSHTDETTDRKKKRDDQSLCQTRMTLRSHK